MGSILKFIKKIEWIESKCLSGSIIIKNAGIVIPADCSFQKMTAIGLASIETTDKVENKIRLFSSKLIAMIPDSFDVGNKKLCFRLTTVSDEVFLLGSFERPYSIVSFNELFPNNPTTKCGSTMTVTYSSANPLLSVLN